MPATLRDVLAELTEPWAAVANMVRETMINVRVHTDGVLHGVHTMCRFACHLSDCLHSSAGKLSSADVQRSHHGAAALSRYGDTVKYQEQADPTEAGSDHAMVEKIVEGGGTTGAKALSQAQSWELESLPFDHHTRVPFPNRKHELCRVAFQ